MAGEARDDGGELIQEGNQGRMLRTRGFDEDGLPVEHHQVGVRIAICCGESSDVEHGFVYGLSKDP